MKKVGNDGQPAAANEPDEIKPAPLRQTLAETLPILERGKAYHAKEAGQYGLAYDVMKSFYDLSEKAPDGELEPFALGFSKYKRFLEAREKTRPPHFNVSSGAYSMTGTATSAKGFSGPELERFLKIYIAETPYWSIDRAVEYGARLAKLDPELGRYYRGISDAFFGLPENQERTAFALARQCFDHLFAVLAPDDDAVRRSPFFRTKEGEKPNAVSRAERIKYAASSRIRDRAQADFLMEQATEMVAGYEELQKLHARQAIDRNRARAVLRTFMASIEQWVDALAL